MQFTCIHIYRAWKSAS